MKKNKYEISLWEDYIVAAVLNEDGAIVIPEHYEERKICNIGSHNMNAQWRAREPKLVENINGTNTFTFKMFYSYIDNETGEKSVNPLLSKLVNERKVKVKWKEKWYDLIIKSQQEDSNGKSITYTCKDQFINELSKTGFDLEFSNELMNNQGTIQELGQRIVEGTDWVIDLENSSTIKQKKEEPVYEATVLNDFTSKEDVLVKAGDTIQIFYSVFNNQESNFFQFWYDKEQVFIQQNKTSMLLSSGECLSLENVVWNETTIRINNINVEAWQIKIGNIVICNISKMASISDDYRAERLVRSQKSSVDANIDKTVLHYAKIIDGKPDLNNIIYSFYETEYPDVLMVQNLITNPVDFNYNDSGWNTIGGIVQIAYPLVDDLENDQPSISYIELKPGQTLYNSGIQNHISAIGDSKTTTGFVAGDEYIFRYKGRVITSNGNPSATYDNGSLIPSFYKKRLNTDTNTYEPIGDTNFTVSGPTLNGRWVEYTVKCNTSIAYKDLSSWGIFLKNKHTSYKRFLQEAQFFKSYNGKPIIQSYDATKNYYEDAVVLADGKYYYCIRDAEQKLVTNATYWKPLTIENEETFTVRINPGSYSTESYAVPVQTFYYSGQKFDEEGKLDYEFQGKEEEVKEWLKENNIVPIYNDNYEKIRSIEAKQSNRFNILQSLAETFQSYIHFDIKHNEETGALVYDNGIPKKIITFLEEVGKEVGYGFVYGKDLKTISRTITSDNISSKVIVSANNNSYAQNGFCTIARATENYPRAEFILNFDYYVTQGLIEKGQINKDLYSTVELIGLGYYHKLHELNVRYDQIESSLTAKRNELLKQESLLQTLQGAEGDSGLIVSINNKINETKNELCFLAGVDSWDDDEVDASGKEKPNGIKDVIDYKNSHSDYTKFQNLYTSYISLNNSLKRYVAQQSQLITSIDNLKSIIESSEKTLDNPDWEKQENGEPGIVQQKEELDKKFYKKYSRFIQEGTWTSEEYTDDNLYYLDAQSVAYTSSRPQIQYNVSVLRLSALEEFKNKVFNLGDISFVEDVEFFGYVEVEGVRTPYKEKVLISEITSNFESPENDSFKVQNYKTQFEDLFQRITATTQSLQYAQGEYARAASGFTSTGEINLSTLQQSLDAATELAWAAKDDSVVIDNSGITVVDITSPNQVVRLSTKGLMFSNDGGTNFSLSVNGAGVVTSSLQSGLINTDKIVIGDPRYPTFKWDKYGLSALGFDIDEAGNIIRRNATKFVRFDRFGLYGMISSNSDSWVPATVEEVWNNANFSVTWKGFRLKNSYGNGYISIDSNEDLIVVDENEIRRIKIGNIGSISNPIYGITIKNNSGLPVMETNSDGTLWLKNRLNISSTQGNGYNIGIGYLELLPEETLHRTIDVNNNFIVYEDGSMVAKNGKFYGHIEASSGSFTGTIIATGGKIGNMTIGEVENVVEDSKGIEIQSSAGFAFKINEDYAVTPENLILSIKTTGFSIESDQQIRWYGSSDFLTWERLADYGLNYNVNYKNFKNKFINGTYYIKAEYIGKSSYDTYVTLHTISDGLTPIYVIVESLKGNIYINNDIETTLIAKAFKGNEEVTNNYPYSSYSWIKYNEDGTIDEEWTSLHKNYGISVTITHLDIERKAKFSCELEL